VDCREQLPISSPKLARFSLRSVRCDIFCRLADGVFFLCRLFRERGRIPASFSPPAAESAHVCYMGVFLGVRGHARKCTPVPPSTFLRPVLAPLLLLSACAHRCPSHKRSFVAPQHHPLSTSLRLYPPSHWSDHPPGMRMVIRLLPDPAHPAPPFSPSPTQLRPSETEEFIQDACVFLQACFRETDLRIANQQRGTKKRGGKGGRSSGTDGAGAPATSRRSSRK